MEDLEIITRVMEQHKVLADQIQSVSATMSDKDALVRMERAQTELSVSFRHPIAERRASLVESLSNIRKALENHYSFEEETLPPLLGKLLTEALIIEHESLVAEMHRVVQAIRETDVSSLDRTGEMRVEAAFNELLGALRDKKLDHQKREEGILLTLQIVCQEKARPSAS